MAAVVGEVDTARLAQEVLPTSQKASTLLDA